MNTTEIIDVTVIEPRLKHPTIFKAFDSLGAGQALVIHNDHDPKPLYYQLLGERGNIFQWEYLEEGPERWKVKISRLGGNEGESTVGEIAASDYRKAEVFKRMGIDFCCGGKKTLSEACKEVGISETQLEAELLKAEQQKKMPSQDFDRWELDFLADYIVNTHHRYVAENVELIYQLAVKVAGHHGEAHPELVTVANIYVAMANELMLHMQKEEEILFPYIKKLVAARRENKSPGASPFGTVGNPVRMMEQEHEQVGEYFREMHVLTNDFTLPPDACNSFTFLYNKLKEFEEDLHQHVHLENNVLFPKALALEKETL